MQFKCAFSERFSPSVFCTCRLDLCCDCLASRYFASCFARPAAAGSSFRRPPPLLEGAPNSLDEGSTKVVAIATSSFVRLCPVHAMNMQYQPMPGYPSGQGSMAMGMNPYVDQKRVRAISAPRCSSLKVLWPPQAHLYIGQLSPRVTEYMLQVRSPSQRSLSGSSFVFAVGNLLSRWCRPWRQDCAG